MGMALTSCTVPPPASRRSTCPRTRWSWASASTASRAARGCPLAGAAEIAEQLVDPILADLDFQGGPSIVMLSGLGGTPLIELYLLYGEVAVLLEKAGVQVARTLVGNYITSLDMAGASVTVLKADDELVRLWDAPVKTAGLRWGL
jgi:dihydroxyacetone kinase-like protein